MKKRTVYETEISGLPIKLEQTGHNRFNVIYWQQVDNGLSYGAAAAKLGEAIMHALACDGRLDA